MNITWIGHSCFKIEKDGYVIVTDPYEVGSVPGLKDVDEQANMVLCSHEHFDHNARKLVQLTAAEKNPFTVTQIDTYHDDEKGAKRGPNTIYILDDGEMKTVHFGDLGCELEPEQLDMLKGIDVALVPVGGFFTIDAAQAANLVKQIQPKVVIPMHFKSEAFGFDIIGSVEQFEALVSDVVRMDGSELKAAQIKDMTGKTVVLKPANL